MSRNELSDPWRDGIDERKKYLSNIDEMGEGKWFRLVLCFLRQFDQKTRTCGFFFAFLLFCFFVFMVSSIGFFIKRILPSSM